MGLDQNWVVKGWRELHYHRKFNALQGFMLEEWAKAGHEEEFNCQYLPVDEAMIDRLEARIKADQLEPTSGFFFGSTEKDEWYLKDIKNLKENVIPDIRERLKNGEEIAYTCWW